MSPTYQSEFNLPKSISAVIHHLVTTHHATTFTQYSDMYGIAWGFSLLSGTYPTSCPVGTGGSFRGIKRPGCEANHSPPTNAEVRKCWSLYIHFTICHFAGNSVLDVLMFINPTEPTSVHCTDPLEFVCGQHRCRAPTRAVLTLKDGAHKTRKDIPISFSRVHRWSFHLSIGICVMYVGQIFSTVYLFYFVSVTVRTSVSFLLDYIENFQFLSKEDV
jgi:hypothetical protein